MLSEWYSVNMYKNEKYNFIDIVMNGINSFESSTLNQVFYQLDF